jgi:hypothetical protein
MCRGPAFLASAYEIRDLIDPIPDSDTAFIGKTYLELHTQRVFCWGTESLTDITQAFLQGSTLRHEAFRGSFHWVMLDQTDRFYRFLSEFLTSQKDSR